MVGLLLLAGCDEDPPSRGTGDEPTGELRSGNGYVVVLPEGWRDVSEERRGSIRESYDRLFSGPARRGFISNVNVIARERPGSLSLDEIGVRAREEVRRGDLGATEITRPRRTRLAGEPALAYSYRLQRRRPPLRGETVLSLRGDRLFLVTFTASTAGYAGDHPAFERILDSWQWS